MDALFAGKLLAVYRDEGEILIVNATRKDAAMLMKTVFINDQQDPIAMAVAPDAPLLQEWLNIFLEEYLRQKSGDRVKKEGRRINGGREKRTANKQERKENE